MTNEPPRRAISNGFVDAEIYLPDPVHGFYRGTRFDWAGVIGSLRCGGHQYFGEWYGEHDPLKHDCITGPAEEFQGATEPDIDYPLVDAGAAFLRMGVGFLRKTGSDGFQRFRTYPLVAPGDWKLHTYGDRVEFQHAAASKSGIAYVYTKTIRLPYGRPSLLLEHSLRNFGARRIDVRHYNHNFLTIDQQPSGPDFEVRLPFELQARISGPLSLDGNRVVFERILDANESALAELTGYSDQPGDYDITVAHRKTGAAVRIRGDRPIEKLLLWTRLRVLCPEPYIRIHLEPGEQMAWTIAYDFAQR